MLEIMPGVSRPGSSSSLQRWWGFYVLMTLDQHNTEYLLTRATELITAACNASACVITYHSPDGTHIRSQSGIVTDEARVHMSQAEQEFLQGRLTPLWQTLYGAPCVALPLKSAAESVGAVHVIAPDPELEPDELQLATLMLNNALQRQPIGEQAAITGPKCIDPKLPTDDVSGTCCATAGGSERRWAEAGCTRLIRREMEVRAQIGRDLHDGPVQQVAVADVAAQYARRVAQCAPEQLPKALDDLQAQLRRITHDLRTVLYELRPLGIVEEGLMTALQQYVERIHDPNGMAVHLDAPSHVRRLDLDCEAALFIIVQEAINNVRKHAAAGDIWIKLHEDDQALYIGVHDNGRGFDLQAVEANYIRLGSFGLLNMRERAQLIGGNCVISSEPGQGTSVEIRVPFAV